MNQFRKIKRGKTHMPDQPVCDLSIEWYSDVAMGWHYISYKHGKEWLSLNITPMFNQPDIVTIPSNERWLQDAPEWAKSSRQKILDRMRAVQWNRELIWQTRDS